MITSAEEFVRLRTSQKQEEYERAHLDNAPHDVWLEVIRDYPDMREWVAHNRTVSVDILRILARDENPTVRGRVVMKHKTHKTPDLQALFAKDADSTIRHAIATSPSTSYDLLEQLSRDEDDWVGRAAIMRLKALEENKTVP